MKECRITSWIKYSLSDKLKHEFILNSPQPEYSFNKEVTVFLTSKISPVKRCSQEPVLCPGSDFLLTYFWGHLLVPVVVHLCLQTTMNIIRWYQDLPTNFREFLAFLQLLKGWFFFFKHRIFISLVLTMSIFICYFLGFNHPISLALTVSVFIRHFIDSNCIVR